MSSQGSVIVAHQLQNQIANLLLADFLPCRIVDCSKKSKNSQLRNRWNQAGSIAGLLMSDFGLGLIELVEFVRVQAQLLECSYDSEVVGCIRHIGHAVSRTGINSWDKLDYEEKHQFIDSAVLRFENAVTSSKRASISIMTVHQSKSRQFRTVIVPWFSEWPWSASDYPWDTSKAEHQNLFHTACTRAIEKVIVVYPEGRRAAWPPS